MDEGALQLVVVIGAVYVVVVLLPKLVKEFFCF
jgi:hypothetical protein